MNKRNNQSAAYLAICYVCNEHCLFCPCSQEEKQGGKLIKSEILFREVRNLTQAGMRQITLSGGEPTMHPDFIPLVALCQECGLKTFVLSNGERFADLDFFSRFKSEIRIKDLYVITTLHSHKPKEHEWANQTLGSWERSIRGLKLLEAEGAHITLKHCITKDNYTDLSDFYRCYNQMFGENVDFQFCGIDYCGMDIHQLKEKKLPFAQMRPYLEKMFDCCIEERQRGNRRRVYCINLPLCACDVFYWSFLSGNHTQYKNYLDPSISDVHVAPENVGTDECYCDGCKVLNICPGAYKTVFSLFEGELVHPY